MKKKLMVAMSGGLDSSVSAYLLKEQGYDLAGVSMCLGVNNFTGTGKLCCDREAIEDAKRVCGDLDIPHYIFDYSTILDQKVIRPFIEEYESGRTPNPCVVCNREIKFGVFLQTALALGFDGIATGHYARIINEKNKFRLCRSYDKQKDQTYFLYSIPYESLQYIHFPVSEMTKSEVRCIAVEKGLPVAQKPESQDICFLQGRTLNEFLSERTGGKKSGYIYDTDGKILGTSRDMLSVTVGQRKGIGISAARPLYVLSLDVAGQKIIAGERKYLFAKGLCADKLNLLHDIFPDRASVKIRYAHKPVQCNIKRTGDKLEIYFDEPQEAVTPGQSAVLYLDDSVIGGGIITGTLP